MFWILFHKDETALKNPESCFLPDDGREIPKLQGRIHVEKDDLLPLCRELVERGVCEWIDYPQ